MRYGFPYGPYGAYGYPQYAFAVMEEKRGIRREAGRAGWAVVAGIAMMFVLAQLGRSLYILQGWPVSYRNADFGGMDPVIYYLLTALAYTGGLAIPVLIYFAVRRIPLSRGLPFERAGFLRTTALVILGSFGCVLANIPANFIVNVERALGFSGDLPEMPLNDSPVVIFLYFVCTAVIPPLVEEMMFRGLILQGLRPFGDGFAVAASAAMFGLYHGNFAQGVFAFLCGLALGLAVVRTNSLLPAILIHMINNASSVFLELGDKYYGAEAAGLANGVRMLLLLGFGILAVIYLLVKDRDFFRARGPASPLRFSAKIGALFTNPGTIALTLYALYSSIRTLTGN